MEINKHEHDDLNFNPNLKPLFDAMEKGDIIKEITLSEKYKELKGENIILNFKATEYWVGMCSNHNLTEHYDYVDGNSDTKVDSFYMNWVVSFRL